MILGERGGDASPGNSEVVHHGGGVGAASGFEVDGGGYAGVFFRSRL